MDGEVGRKEIKKGGKGRTQKDKEGESNGGIKIRRK